MVILKFSSSSTLTKYAYKIEYMMFTKGIKSQNVFIAKEGKDLKKNNSTTLYYSLGPKANNNSFCIIVHSVPDIKIYKSLSTSSNTAGKKIRL